MWISLTQVEPPKFVVGNIVTVLRKDHRFPTIPGVKVQVQIDEVNFKCVGTNLTPGRDADDKIINDVYTWVYKVRTMQAHPAIFERNENEIVKRY